MRVGKRRIIVIGDRVLIRPDESAEKSPAGLYLPPTVREKEDVWGGVVVEVGPGLPVSDPNSVEEEPWKTETENVRYIPPSGRDGRLRSFPEKSFR